MQRILEKFMKNFRDELFVVATLMIAVLHVLLSNLTLFHSVQSYHPQSREYIDMQPFTMHYF